MAEKLQKEKTPMSKGKKIALWVGGSIVGLFVLLMVIGGISAAMNPDEFAQFQAEQEAERSAKADQKAAEESAKAEESKRAEEEAAAEKKAEEEAAVKAQEESDKDAAEKRAAEEAEAKKKADAEKAAAEKKAAEEKKRAATPEGIAGSAGVDDLTVFTEGSVVFAEFPIADNFSKGMIASGAKRDTLDILKAVRESGMKYSRVFVQGKFPMQDSYGNSSVSMVVNAGYDKATVDKINFDGINPDGIWGLRDAGMVHPEFQG